MDQEKDKQEMCDCDCHKPGSTTVHCVACCRICPVCNSPIQDRYIREHVTRCKEEAKTA
jgi:hypothetical protein